MASPENPAAAVAAAAADEALPPPIPSAEASAEMTAPIVDSHPREVAPEGSAAGVKRKSSDGEAGSGGEGPANPLWKTSLCSFFRRRGGDCSHGAGCRYAHGEEELRPRPDSSWDPTSERAKRLRESEGEGPAAEEVEDGREDLVPPESPGEGDGKGEVALDKCLVNLPRKWLTDNLKSFLTTQGITYKTAKKKKGMTVGFVSFETFEHVENATQELNGKSMGNKKIKVANVLPRSFPKKHDLDGPFSQVSNNQAGYDNSLGEPPVESVEGVDDKDGCTDNKLTSRMKTAREVVTPLAHLSYTDQLEHKKTSLSQTLKRLTRNARKACPAGCPLPEWIGKSREIGGLPCKLEGILESPLVNGYRNKCEFSVGYSFDGKRTVGFMLGNFREGMTAVEEPVNCPNVSSVACKYALMFQEFLQTSNFLVWNRLNNTGFWRQLTVREGRNPQKEMASQNIDHCIAEIMLIVQVCSSDTDSETVKLEFEKMVQAFVQGASSCTPPLPLTAVVVQDHKGISNAAPSDCPLFTQPLPNADNLSGTTDEGDKEARIHDYISGLRFSISPTAFFQVNTLAAEKLYSLAGDWADLGPDTLLFDICCGTGTIGLTLARRVGMVVGIEMNESAISDANRNAGINGIKNCRFICSKAEDVMGTLLREYLDIPSQESNINLGYDGICGEEKCAEDMSGCLSDNGCLSIQKGVLEVEKNSDKTSDRTEANSPLHKMENGNRFADEKCNNGVQDLDITVELSKDSMLNGCPSQQFKDVVAIVDPPRPGLHPTVIKALRTHPRLRRLIYISCNPESLVANAIELCTPAPEKPVKAKNNRGWRNMSSAGLARRRTKSMPNSEPFRPVRAMAVDLFPHTPHCEMVMLLER